MIGRLALLALALAAARDDPLAGRIAGKPVECIDPHFTQGPTVVDAHTILYTETGRRVWRTGPVGSCPELEPISTLIVELRSGELCHNDMFRVLRSGETIPGPYCRFDRFTPYDKPAPVKARSD